jgi:predicted DNA-binding transcriptional regulator YafY
MQAAGSSLEVNVSSLPANPLTADEFDSILLGLCWAMEDEEPSVATAAATACEKIAAMLPEPPPLALECPAPNPDDPSGSSWIPFLEAAAESERKLSLVYRDKTGNGSQRVIWPLMVDFWRKPEAIVAWCEARRDFRVFRVDRIQSLALEERYPARRQVLIAKWQLREDEEQ